MKSRIILALLLSAAFGASAQSSMEAKGRADAVVDKIKSQYAPDKRQAVYEVKAYMDNGGALVVGGILSDSATCSELRRELHATGIDFADCLVVMPYDQWALVRLTAASMRTGGRHAAEMATQNVMGTPLRVLAADGDWYRVQSPDGYISYIPSSSVVLRTSEEMAQWRRAPRFIVVSPWQVQAFRTADATGVRDVVTDLVNGCIVEIPASVPNVQNGKLEILLPDGRRAFVDAKAMASVTEWAAQDFNADRILDTAYSMEGTPYLWGGTSTKAIDCSGLAKVSYFSNGIILMRDASQQATTGTRIEAKDWRQCRPGDLLFFGNAKTGRVTHVAIYDSKGNYVHSSGRVKRNSVDPDAESYLTTPFLHAVRIAGNEETRGIFRARNHPWYF